MNSEKREKQREREEVCAFHNPPINDGHHPPLIGGVVTPDLPNMNNPLSFVVVAVTTGGSAFHAFTFTFVFRLLLPAVE